MNYEAQLDAYLYGALTGCCSCCCDLLLLLLTLKRQTRHLAINQSMRSHSECINLQQDALIKGRGGREGEE